MDDAGHEDGQPDTPVRRLVSVELHELALHGERIVARQRVEQTRASGERSDSGHDLRHHNDGEAHKGQALPDGIVKELGDRNSVGRSLHAGDTLYGE